MAVQITNIQSRSLADRAGLKSGDILCSINKADVNDLLDLLFLMDDSRLELTYIRSGKEKTVTLLTETGIPVGIDVEEMKVKCCGNSCIYCFVDQNPEGMRNSLYVKDEDYRYSFMFGSYVTLTTVKQRDLDRIIRYGLSPLYVSANSIYPDIRKKLFGLKKDDHAMEKIEQLIKNGIQLHGQIVLVPGVNDNKSLIDTIEYFADRYPDFRSLAIVPVGLTRHRNGLAEIEPVTEKYARELVQSVASIQEELRWKKGETFVYLSDEFYIKAGLPFPDIDRYDDFYQIENGVGMVVSTLAGFRRVSAEFPQKVERKTRCGIVTGCSGKQFIENEIVPALNKIEGFKAEVIEVKNRFFGESVTVSGLLTARDIIDTLKDAGFFNVFILPENCVNFDNVFLDDLTIEDIRNAINVDVRIIENSFAGLFG